MSVDSLQTFLGWCTLINFGLLAVWLMGYLLAHNWIFRQHSRCFEISKETFDSIHYAGMAFYKISIFLLNLVPYLALRLMG